MSEIKIVLVDFLNYYIEGLSKRDLMIIQKETGVMEKGAFMLASYKSGIWDGKTAYINDDGVGMVRDLPRVLDVIEGTLGYTDVDFVDSRPIKLLRLPTVDEEWLKDETGYSLYDYQVNGINAAVGLTHCDSGIGGILKLATNSGKSLTTVGISKVFDKKIKTVVIVPSTNLVEQTYADYCKSDMSTVALLAKIPPKQRENAINNHDHVILTGKLFLNVHKFFQRDEWVVMYDEVHEFGEMMSQAIRESLGHCQYRIGLTATMPEEKKDFYKDGLIRNHFGDNLVQMEQKELIDRGISSAIHIDMVTVSTPVDAISLMSDDWDWNKELLYYNTNALRCDAFLEQIKKESCGNNLILCAPELGEVLAERLGINLVQDSVPSDQRGIWYAEFKEASDYSLLATFGCASTGLSINNIQTLFLLEIGKDRTRIMQSIGRGLRLDGKENFIRVVDISSCTKYARNHRKERLKIYNAEGFSNEAYKEIVVDHDSPFGE